MRYLPVLLQLSLLSLFLSAGSLPAYCAASDPVEQAQKWADEAKDQAAKAKAAKAKLDCEKPKTSDKNALIKAIKAARSAAENAQKWANQAKSEAEKAGKAADANPNNKKAQEAKEKADQAATDAQKAADDAQKAYENALAESPAMKTAADLEKALDKADASGNSEKKKIVDRLKNKAQSAAEADPCDPEAVKRAVRVELEKIRKEVSGNGEVRPWVEDLSKSLTESQLIFFRASDTDVMVYNITRTGPAIRSEDNRLRPHLLFGLTGVLQPAAYAPAFTELHLNQLQMALFEQPEILEQLFIRLNGDFWIGSPSQPGVFSSSSNGSLHSLGLRAMLPIGRHTALQASIVKGQHSAKAKFPVTVFSQHTGKTGQLEGSASLHIQTFQAQLTGRYYFFSSHVLQVYTGAGAQFCQQTTGNLTAELQGISWATESKDKQTYWDLSGQLGLSLQPKRLPVFLEIGGALQHPFQSNAGSTALGLEMTIGWLFR